MKQTIRFNRFWQILYPLAIYYVLYNGFAILFNSIIGQGNHRLLWLGIAGLITLIPVYKIYKELPIYRPEKKLQRETLLKEVGIILGVVIIGILLNIILTQTGLVQVSKGYKSANKTLYDGDFITRVFATCITIPILEEVIYRGIILGQLKIWYSPKIAIPLSAFFFGAMHFNVVQLIYGCLMGLVLGYAYFKTSKLWVVIVAHGLTNFVVVCITTFILN